MKMQILQDITDSEFKLLKWVLENSGKVPADYFFIDPNVDGHVEELVRNSLLAEHPEQGMQITEYGRAFLAEREEMDKRNRRKLIWEIVRFFIPVAISILSLVISIMK